MMPSAAKRAGFVRRGSRAGGSMIGVDRGMQQAGGGERKGRGERDDTARRGQRGLQRDDHEPDRGEGGDAAGLTATARDEAGRAPARTEYARLRSWPVRDR